MTKPIRTIKILFETLRELSLGNKDTALNYLHSLNVETERNPLTRECAFWWKNLNLGNPIRMLRCSDPRCSALTQHRQFSDQNFIWFSVRKVNNICFF